MNTALVVIAILFLIFAFTFFANDDYKKGLFSGCAAVLSIVISWIYPGTKTDAGAETNPPTVIEIEINNPVQEETQEKDTSKEAGEINSDGFNEDEGRAGNETDSTSKKDNVENVDTVPDTSIEEPSKPDDNINSDEEITSIKLEPTVITKKSYLEYEEGWDCIGKELDWGEWSQTETPKSLQNTETYEVKLVRDKKTKIQYRYYNWWYYQGNVKMFSSDNNGGTIPQEQYWEEWFDYTMEDRGYVKKYDQGDGVEFWLNKSNNDCRYFGGEREVEVQPALYEEREGRYLYLHSKIVYE